jgi:hypothetical protein
MRFTPVEKALLPEGDYDFVVEDAKERTSSKTGALMIEVKLKITSPKGKTAIVYDNLMAWNMDSFLLAVGESVIYDVPTDVEAYDLPGKSGRAHIIIEHSVQYSDKNKVGKYLPSAQAKPSPVVGVNELGEPDNLPF